jgi:hypothetical protein
VPEAPSLSGNQRQAGLGRFGLEIRDLADATLFKHFQTLVFLG